MEAKSKKNTNLDMKNIEHITNSLLGIRYDSISINSHCKGQPKK
jgi:hypothetical protein